MSVVLNVEFTEFFSSNYDNDEIEITYRVDDKNYNDKFPNSKGNIITLTQIKKDCKISIKVHKENNIIGTGEINLSQNINLREKSVNKWINLSPQDIKKSLIMSNTLNNMMKINIKITISYLGNLKSQHGNEESSQKKDSTIKLNTTNSKPSGSNPSNKKMQISSKRTNSVNTNNNNSTVYIDYKNKSMNESDIKMNTINTSSNMSDKSKNGNICHLVISTYSHNQSVSENVTPNNKSKKGKILLTNTNNKNIGESVHNHTNQKSERNKLKRKASSEKEGNFSKEIDNNTINEKLKRSGNNTPIFKETPVMTVQNLDLDEETGNKEIDEENNSSVACSLINEENNQDLETPLAEMNELCERFTTFYNEFYLENIPDDEFLLQNESTLIMEEMFKLHDHYHKSYNDFLNTNMKLREITIKNNTKYRTIARKIEILKKKIELDSMNKVLNLNLNNEGNKRMKEMIDCLQKEIRMLKIIYRVKAEKEDITKFIKENQEEIDNDKELLRKSFNNVLKNSKLQEKISSESRIFIEKYLNRNVSKEEIRSPQNKTKINLEENSNVPISDNYSKKEDSKLNTNQSLNPLEDSALKTIATDQQQSRQSKQLEELNTFTGENFLSFNQNTSDKNKLDQNDLTEDSIMYHSNYNNLILTFKKRSEKDEGMKNDLEEEFEKKLDNYINQFYSRKKISNVKFKSLGNGDYEFGSLKIKIIYDSEGFKVKNSQSLIPLSKFIESNANNEELKSLKNNSLFSLGKGSKKTGESSKETNSKSSGNSTKMRTTTPTNMKKLLK